MQAPMLVPLQMQGGTLPAGLPVVTPQVMGVAQSGTLPAPARQKAAPRHIPLARCRALYLGSAVPLDTSQGLEAVQGPLRERYPFETGDLKGIDVWLSVFSSGLAINYVNDKSGNTWFPISSLYVCAAVRCVVDVMPNGDMNPRFVALDSEEGRNKRHPPMFSCIMRRQKGVKVLECHVFVAKSEQAAMALVQSCTHAYEHKEGWTSEVPAIVTRNNLSTRLVAAEKHAEADVPPEFYQKPPEQGYFYTTDRGLVKNYNVFGSKSEERKQQQQPAPGGPAPPPQPVYHTGYAPPGGPPVGPPGPHPGHPGPHPGMMGPPMMGPPGMLPPGMHYPTLPPPPPGYFADWDRYEGRPIAVLGDRYTGPEPPRGPPPGGARYEERYGRGPPPPGGGPPPREYRRAKPSRRHSPPRGAPRGRPQSPPRRRFPPRDHHHDREYREYRDYRDSHTADPYRHGPPPQQRPRTPPADYERTGRAHAPEHHGDDFVLYAPRYKERFPEDFDRRHEGREHVEYKSYFNPEIVMKGSKEYRGGGGADQRDGGGMYLDEENVYRYERDLPMPEDGPRYPRGDRAFERSLAEERDTIGDQYSDRGGARGDFDTESNNIEYGMFHGGRPYDHLEDTLGYYP